MQWCALGCGRNHNRVYYLDLALFVKPVLDTAPWGGVTHDVSFVQDSAAFSLHALQLLHIAAT